jgi:dTDP-4-dehydrorhamnose reductase
MTGLILGASGQVGLQLMQQARSICSQVVGTGYRQCSGGLVPLDLRDEAGLARLIAATQPEVIFLPAAYTNVDQAEADPQTCWAVNVTAVVAVARLARQYHARLVFFSTDHVFGESDRPQDEDEPTMPQSVYARSKVAAEGMIRALLPHDHLILRTSWVYGFDPQRKNFAYRVLHTLRLGQPLRVPLDQFGQPTYNTDLARVACELVRHEMCGTYHVVGPSRLSRYCLARMLAQRHGLDPELLQPVTTAELAQRAPRPLSVWLSTAKLSRELGSHWLRPISRGIDTMRLAEQQCPRAAA